MLKDTKQTWFKEAKYGLFIHWGLYTILAGEYKGRQSPNIGEWIMNHLDIPVTAYEQLASQFNPVDFDSEDYVRRAKEWGMKYIVFTAKHHDGFAMYHSRCNRYNVVDATPFGRDIVKELQLACEKHGMRLGLYYSQAQDWHDPDGYVAGKDNSTKNFRKYLDRKCIPQLRELLTGYGPLSLIWFDTPMSMKKEESEELIRLVKSLQPDCLINGRIGNNLGDYLTTGDNFIPLLPYKGDWEVPATLNDTWGYKKHDHNWKSADEIWNLLLKINGRGGNYLLNVGPDEKGNIPEESVRILTEVGGRIHANADGIYATVALDTYQYDLDWALFTTKAHKLFINVVKPVERYLICNIANTIEKAFILESDQEIRYLQSMTCEKDHVWEFFPPNELVGKRNFTIAVDIKEEKVSFEPLAGWEFHL